MDRRRNFLPNKPRASKGTARAPPGSARRGSDPQPGRGRAPAGGRRGRSHHSEPERKKQPVGPGDPGSGQPGEEQGKAHEGYPAAEEPGFEAVAAIRGCSQGGGEGPGLQLSRMPRASLSGSTAFWSSPRVESPGRGWSSSSTAATGDRPVTPSCGVSRNGSPNSGYATALRGALQPRPAAPALGRSPESVRVRKRGFGTAWDPA